MKIGIRQKGEQNENIFAGFHGNMKGTDLSSDVLSGKFLFCTTAKTQHEFCHVVSDNSSNLFKHCLFC